MFPLAFQLLVERSLNLIVLFQRNVESHVSLTDEAVRYNLVNMSLIEWSIYDKRNLH